ncbi:MAG TPA: fibronectin type III domain-containing protein, partial [Solirubrobacterales bacterium]|nr:fibronectin type III domain-containing protein [Solirubrobacterales bacterium]
EGTHGACAGISSANGLGVRGSSGNVYVSSTSGGQRIYVLNTGQPVAPTVSITNVSGIDAHGATINALINPNGPELPYGHETTYKLEYKRSADAGYRTFYNLEASAGNRTVNKAVTLSLSGLQANTSYDARLVITKGLGSGSASQTVSFNTTASAPDVALGSFIAVSGDEARLEGAINPNGQAAGYHFDYVDQVGFEDSGFSDAESAPSDDASAGSGSASVPAAAEVSGLSLGTTYHYRLVGSSAAGENSAAGTFTTPVDPASCPNAKLRTEQVSPTLPGGTTYLPHCMALELASAAKKFNQYAKEGSFALNEDRVIYKSLAALGDTQQLYSLFDPYVAVRGPSNWTTKGLGIPPENFLQPFSPCAIKPDGSGTVTPGATVAQSSVKFFKVFEQNIDGTTTELTPLMIPRNTSGQNVIEAQCSGVTTEGPTRFFFGYRGASYSDADPVMASEAIGALEAGLDENGTPGYTYLARDRNGVVYGNGCGADIAGVDGVRKGSISADGSIVYLANRPTQGGTAVCNQSTNKKRILRRVMTPLGPEISEISTSECTRTSTLCDRGDGDDAFHGASLEGDRAYFTSPRQLTDSDLDSGTECQSSPSESKGCDLYLYDANRPAGSRLTQVSVGDQSAPTPGSGAEVFGVLDTAGDGSRVYFAARGVLTTKPNPVGEVAEAGQPNLYVYERNASHPNGRVSFIGIASPSDDTLYSVNNRTRTALAVPMLGEDTEDTSVGGDGHVLVFLTSSSLTPDDQDGGEIDIFRYDSAAETLERVSRAAPGGSDNGPFAASPSGNTGGFATGQVDRNSIGGVGNGAEALVLTRKVSEDGRTIGFVTTEELSPEDTDEKETTYIWDEGELAPVFGAVVPGVSPSGDGILFQTGRVLLAQDTDTAVDVYVARADGGYPVPQEPILCQGEACQEPFGSQPAEPSPQSQSFTGPGNVRQAPSATRCGKRSVRRHGRCVKKKRKQSARNRGRANHKQGGQK